MDNIAPKILTLPEAAKFLRVSTSWLARNWQKHGGVKLAGKILFPGERELYDRIFRNSDQKIKGKKTKDKGIPVRFPVQKTTVSKCRFSNQNGSEGGGGQTTEETENPIDYSQDLYNLFGVD